MFVYYTLQKFGIGACYSASMKNVNSGSVPAFMDSVRSNQGQFGMGQ